MYQQDYMMREIEGLTRMIANALFGKQMQTEELIDAENLVCGEAFFRHTLFQTLSDGNVNEAENLLHERLEEDPRPELLQTALEFYARLARMTDGDLIRCGFSREEIAEGLEAVRRDAQSGALAYLNLTLEEKGEQT